VLQQITTGSTLTTQLCLSDVSTGQESELTVFSGNDIPIGREPESGVCVIDDGISRRHGRFMRQGSHWFYEDLGSTNGSFINGVELDPGILNLVRDTDILQMADICLRIRERTTLGGVLSESQRMSRSTGLLLVMRNGILLREMPVYTSGVILTIGGNEALFELDTDTSSFPALVVEFDGKNVFAYGVNEYIQPLRFGSPISGRLRLENRIVLSVDEYTVIYETPLVLDEISVEEDPIAWIAQKNKRRKHVQLVELKPKVSIGCVGMGKGLVPVTKEEANKDLASLTCPVVTSRAVALVTSAVTSTTNKRAPFEGPSNRDRAHQVKELEQNHMMIARQIGDTLSVVSGIIGCFVIVLSMGFLMILGRGDNLQVVLGL
jgi:pSer/pThr/pTyr-binding forkhead associated (FHA) protein